MFSFNSSYYNFFDLLNAMLEENGEMEMASASYDKRETMIVFVYDTECLKDESEDPVKAVLYFHPSWVSDTQKVALCGQLMGTSYFLKDCFFKPRIIALQNGKFVLKEFGRFILAVGSDRNISDYLLEHRVDLLTALVKFYHRDLQLVYDQFPLQSQYKNLSEKLYHIFETYLPILQYNGNIFQNIPKLRIPKTANNIFLEAIQTLQCCQQTKGILGGAILYHNKVVATQLTDYVTKQIVLTDPLHIRNTAEHLTSTDFHIPNGVLMLVIYLNQQQYRKLQAEAQRAQNLQTTQLGSGQLPFQYSSKRKMKRDKSLIFTHIPEEGSSHVPQDFSENLELAQQISTPTRPKPLLNRPTHLPLRIKSYNNKELPESGIASINFDENDSYPEFIGRTSVCSTPMAENKVLAVGNIMSICANPEDENNSNNYLQDEQITLHMNRCNSLRKDFEKFFHNFITNPNKLERRNSLADLQQSLKKLSKKITLKQFSQSFKTDVNRNGEAEKEVSPDFIENDDDNSEENSDNSDENNRTSRTITDPTYPVFNSNGQPISRSLFQEFLEKYYKLWGEAAEESRQNNEIANLIEEFKEFDTELQKLDESIRSTTTAISQTTALKKDRNLNLDLNLEIKSKTSLDKKSLSLPLKSISLATPSTDKMSATMSLNNRKQLSNGVPLTPLMAKLSVLALNEERPTWDSASGTGIEIQTPLTASKMCTGKRNSLKCEDAVDALVTLPTQSQNIDGLQKAELYICGQQNMTLVLIMESGCSQQQKIVQKMFDICVGKFPHMESYLNQTLNINVDGEQQRDGSYSFMCIDSKWDALQRNGPWNPVEINTIECMHTDLLRNEQVTDLVLRSYDSIFYGYKSGRTEIFYKEPAKEISGIPPPSDVMGNIITKAKTHLERDHSEQKSRKIEEIIFCNWPERYFNPITTLQTLPNVKFLSIEHGPMKEILYQFPEMFYLQSINISWTDLSYIGPKTFKHVYTLRVLDLRWNQLMQLDSPLILSKTVEFFYLNGNDLGNPWNCTRNLKWLLTSDKGYIVTDRRDLLCYDRKYKERHLLTVMNYKMILKHACQSNEDLRNCTCSMHHIVPKSHIPLYTVNCSYLGLYRLPAYLPDNTSSFYANGNKITDISPLRNNNHYRYVDDIHLDNNLIESIDVLEGSYWFEHFRLLNLKGNRLRKIPVYALDNALDDNPHASLLALSQNPWHCSCKFAMRFREILNKYNAILKDAWNITCIYKQGDELKSSTVILIKHSTGQFNCARIGQIGI
uniref:CCZ1/INTU/HSP4 first Longin domain-containing protein n=1 Tax=Glossina brevipalpis TaxID=37001 RepID=A0A1A9WC71_9MUSC